MRREGYVVLVSVVTAGVILTLGVMYFAIHSGALRNLFPVRDVKKEGSTLGVFAQNAQPGTGNLKSSLPTQNPSRPTATLTPRIVATIVPTVLVTRIAQTIAPTSTVPAPAAIPASGTSTWMWLFVPVTGAGGVYLLRQSKRV